jgi:N-acetylmuramoyl-L-alanine amidase
MKVCHCGNEIVENPPSIVVAAGWCAPKEVAYNALPEVEECSDCKARMMMIMTIGIDPGHNGENLKVKRGGIRYERS